MDLESTVCPHRPTAAAADNDLVGGATLEVGEGDRELVSAESVLFSAVYSFSYVNVDQSYNLAKFLGVDQLVEGCTSGGGLKGTFVASGSGETSVIARQSGVIGSASHAIVWALAGAAEPAATNTAAHASAAVSMAARSSIVCLFPKSDMRSSPSL